MDQEAAAGAPPKSPFGMNGSLGVEVMVVVIALLALIAKYYFKTKITSSSSSRRSVPRPPGPGWALPLLGHLIQMGLRPHLAFAKWRKIYGPMFSLQFGSYSAVVVSDHKLVKQLFSQPASIGRLHNVIFDEFSGGTGLISRDDEGWLPQRRFALRTLKELGLKSGGGVLEGIIADEAGRLVSFFEKRVELPIPGNRVFNGAVLNSLWTMLTGQRHEWDVPVEPEHLAKSGRVMRMANRALETGLAFFTWLRLIAPSWSGWNEWVEANHDLAVHARGIVEGHVAARQQHLNSRDYVDLYLDQVEATTEPTSSFYGEAGMGSLIGNVADLIFAGTETTSTTLEYIILYIGKHNHVQREIHSELDGVVGRSRTPNLADRRELPYTEAVILEVSRLASIFPMGVVHRALEDIELASYVIRKDTLIFADYYNIHRDARTWGEDSADFRPERFLNDAKTKVVYHEALLPFSTGRRACIGESLANDSLFIFLTCLMQKFSVELCDGNDEDGIELDDPLPGFIFKPKPFKMVMSLRNK